MPSYIVIGETNISILNLLNKFMYSIFILLENSCKLLLNKSSPNSNTRKVVRTFKVSISWFNYIRLLRLLFGSIKHRRGILYCCIIAKEEKKKHHKDITLYQKVFFYSHTWFICKGVILLLHLILIQFYEPYKYYFCL